MTHFPPLRPAAALDGDSPPTATPPASPGEDERRQALLFMLEDLEEDRRKIERARHEWAEVFDSILDPLFLHDKEFRIIRANLAYARAAGMDIRDVIGKYYWEVFPKSSGPLGTCAHAMQHAKAEEAEEEVRTESGRLYQSRAYALRDNENQYLYSLHILRDITERKHADMALRDEKLFSEGVVESLPGIFFFFDSTGRFVRWNRNLETVSGYTHEEIARMHPLDFVATADRPRIAGRIAQIFEHGEAAVEVDLITKGGRRIPFFFLGRLVVLAGGNYAHGVGIDISERRQAEVLLSESEERLRLALGAAHMGTFDWDVPANRITWSHWHEELWGFKPGEFAGTYESFSGRVHPEDLPGLNAEIERCIAARTPYAYEFRVVWPDGGLHWISGRGEYTFGSDGKPLRMRGTVIEITERKRNEQERRETLARLQKQFKAVGEATASEALWTADLPRYVRELTEIGAQATGVERVNLWLFNQDETELCCLDLYEATPARHSAGMKLTEKQFTREFAAFKSARYVDADDPLTDPRTAGYLESYLKPLHITSMLDAIVQHGGKHLGVLCFEHVDKAHHWEPDEIAFACQLADKFGLALVSSERLQAQKALSRSNRALRTLSACNETLVRATDEETLLRDMCQVVVDVGGYRLAWVGWVEHDAAKSVRPAAHAGYDAGYLETIQLSWADAEHGHGPTGVAIRSGEPQVARDIQSDPRYAPWHAQALKRGYASNLALPLKDEDGEVFAVLNVYASEPDAFGQEEIGLLRELASDLAFGLRTLRTRTEHNRLQEEYSKSGERLKAALINTIRAIALTVEKRDPYTAGHQQRVAELCVAIGGELGLDENRLEGLRLGATIHDIGKIYIPAEILNRPGRLTSPEFEMIKSHPEVGYDIIKDVKFPWPLGEMILQHHERIDGSGYPNGLKGDAITLEARILAVADTVEAMYSHRPYRPAHGLNVALAEIEAHRGTRYDAAAVDACLRLFKEKDFTLERP